MLDPKLQALELSEPEVALLDELGVTTFRALAGLVRAAPEQARKALGEDLAGRIQALAADEPVAPKRERKMGARFPEDREDEPLDP